MKNGNSKLRQSHVLLSSCKGLSHLTGIQWWFKKTNSYKKLRTKFEEKVHGLKGYARYIGYFEVKGTQTHNLTTLDDACQVLNF